MSTLTRDWPQDRPVPSQPPLTRCAPVRHGTAGQEAQARYQWPDPIDVVPSQDVPTGQAAPAATSWPAEPQPQSWPPMPASDFGAPLSERNDAPVGVGFDPSAALPSAQFTPAQAETTPPPQQAPRPDNLRSVSDKAGQGAARVLETFSQSNTGGIALPEGWSSLSSIPDEPRARADYSPSRMMYRLNRMWLTPVVRQFVRVGLPVLLVVALIGGYLSDAERRASLIGVFTSVRLAVENRPEFRVESITVESRSPEVALGVEQLLGIQFPISSFHLDLSALRETAEALDAVQNASIQVRSGVLQVVIEERLPAMIWRNHTGLDLIDGTGHRVARLGSRGARPDLPLIAGAGAPDAIAEARLLWAAARPLRDRMRGLVRIGERRWDVVLDRGQRILLPPVGALGALERVMALNSAQDLLARDVQVVDMRNPSRPTLRLSPEAMDELTRIRRISSGG